jgi:hypothetical protein
MTGDGGMFCFLVECLGSILGTLAPFYHHTVTSIPTSGTINAAGSRIKVKKHVMLMVKN